jgi:hypothetical protein
MTLAVVSVALTANRMMLRGVWSCFVLGLGIVAGGVCAGCGPVAYSLDSSSVERVVSAARAENAGYYAPYELYFAEAHLDKAHEEAAQGHYEDAIHALVVARTYGKRALERSAQPGSPVQ